MSELDGLDIIVNALAEHEQRSATDRGERFTVECERCGWRAWSYTGYLVGDTTIDDGRAFMLSHHECVQDVERQREAS